MADIKYNTMRFLTDEFNPYIRQALLVSNAPLDLTNFNRLDQLTVLGNEPTGSKRRFMFKMDNKVYKFSGQNLVEYTGTLDIDNVLNNGNSAAQLEAVSNNSQLVGKNIFPIIALYSEVADAPTAKIIATASLVQDVLDFEKEHSAKSFYDENIQPEGGRVLGTILGFDWDVETNGNASADFKVQLMNQDGEWSDYMKLSAAKGQNAKAVRPKFFYHVDAVDGINSVKIKKFYIYWSPDLNFNAYGDSALLYSVIKNFALPLKSCVLVVRYEPLDGGSISADVAFLKNRSHVSAKVLGEINSAQKSFNIDENFIPNSLKLFINGVETTNFTFNTADNSITLPADNERTQATVSADFTYDEDEIWLPMVADQPEPADNGLYTSRFSLKNPYDYSTPRAAIRLTINRGRNVKSTTRVATGEEQRIKLSRIPDEIDCDAPCFATVGDFYGYYDDETNEYVFKCAEGDTVTVSYTWHGKTPVLTGWQAAFAT